MTRTEVSSSSSSSDSNARCSTSRRADPNTCPQRNFQRNFNGQAAICVFVCEHSYLRCVFQSEMWTESSAFSLRHGPLLVA